MVNTPISDGGEYLIVRYININKHSPEFTARHGSVVKLLWVEFISLDTLLHQEVLIELLWFITYIQDRMNSKMFRRKKPYFLNRFVRESYLFNLQEETSDFLKEQFLKEQKQRLRRDLPNDIKHKSLNTLI